MKNILLFLSIIFSTNVIAQPNKSKQCIDSTDSFWYIWSSQLAKKINLDDLENNDNIWNFRLWTEKQVIDLWIDKGQSKHGKVTNWVEECSKKSENPTNRLFSTSTELSSQQAEDIISIIKSMEIESIPDQNSIEDWNQELEGTTYIIELSDKDSFYFKVFISPKLQDNVQEAITLQKFIDKTLKISKANNIWTNFKKQIPFECYVTGGVIINCQKAHKK